MGGGGGGGGGRSPCCDKSKVKKGPWSSAEDVRLVSFIQKHGHPNWRSLPKQAGLLRCGKSCRLRWINYLRPDVKRGNFTPQEEHSILRLHATFGNKWSKIASQLPGRTDNEIKNVWNTHLKKRSQCSNKNIIQTPSSSSSDLSNVQNFTNQEISSSHNHHEQQVDQAQHDQTAAPSRLVQDQASSPLSTVSCKEHDETNNINLEIPLESEVEFWKMLESQPITNDHDHKEMEAVEYWLRLLEEELGLVGPTADIDDDQTKLQPNPEIWCKISSEDQISPLMWPTSPQNFGF